MPTNKPFASMMFASVLIALTGSVAFAQNGVLVLDDEGRVLAPYRRAGRSAVASVVVRNVSSQSRDQFRLQCRPMNLYDNQAVPLTNDQLIPITNSTATDLVFSITVPSQPFLFCSLLRLKNSPLSDAERRTAEERVTVLNAEQAALAGPLASLPERATVTSRTAELTAARTEGQARLQKTTDDAKDAIANLDTRITHLLEDISAFQQRETDTAVTEIKRLQEQVRSLREEIAKHRATIKDVDQQVQASVAAAEKAKAQAQAVLDATGPAKQIARVKKELADVTKQLSDLGTPRYSLLNTSHLFLDQLDRTVVYRVVEGTRDKGSIALERAGAAPILTTDTRVFAVIVNRRHKDLPQPFQLTFTTSVEAAPTPAPVRPSESLTAHERVVPLFEDDDKAFTDFVLAFGPPFKANTVVKATIATVVPVTTKEETTETTTIPPESGQPGTKRTTQITTAVQRVELIKDEEYPQVRPLYRFNFTTGVTFSALRDPSFIRIKTQLEDPTTNAKAMYADATVKGDVSVRPMFGITVYPRGVDIQCPLTWSQRVVPAPMIGFSFVEPQNNIYVGFTNEIVRNVQLMYGVHVGKITVLRTAGAIDDPSSSDAPATDQRFHAKGFIGVSFNIEFIKTIFAGH